MYKNTYYVMCINNGIDERARSDYAANMHIMSRVMQKEKRKEMRDKISYVRARARARARFVGKCCKMQARQSVRNAFARSALAYFTFATILTVTIILIKIIIRHL